MSVVYRKGTYKGSCLQFFLYFSPDYDMSFKQTAWQWKATNDYNVVDVEELQNSTLSTKQIYVYFIC